jgi:L-alanine-DL-glutamate epimerase-like enolase superfamily enzyme
VNSISEITAEPLDLELTEPFGIATGAQERARNVLCRLVASGGATGLGEAAPFPAVNGETQELALSALREAGSDLLGLSLDAWRATAERARELLAHAPSALCAFETALLDAYARSHSLSLHSFFGGRERELHTDITITTGAVEAAAAAALRAREAGFATLKVKIGGSAAEHDVLRLRAVGDAAPKAALLLDGNAAFSADQALALLQALGPLRERVVLFEQPTAADDLWGLSAVRRHGRVAVAADESARSAADVARLGAMGAADTINVKITKCGIVEALDMIGCARSHGLGLMIGGMVESRLCMSTSACLAAGVGGFRFVDLDTPLFLRDDPFDGGFRQRGPRLELDSIQAGHGVQIHA